MNVMLISIPVLTGGSGAPQRVRPLPESTGLRDSPRHRTSRFFRAMSIRAIVTRRSVVTDRFAVRTAGRLRIFPFPFKESQQCASW